MGCDYQRRALGMPAKTGRCVDATPHPTFACASMKVEASTVSEYLATLAPERRTELEAVRRVIEKHLPKGYAEELQYGMIGFVVPLKTFPEGYLGKTDAPLPYVSLAAQKRYLAVYLMNVYADPKLERSFRAAYAKSGKKLA